MSHPGPSTDAPSVFFSGDDPSLLLQCAEALVDFFPAARLSLPLNAREALELARLGRYDLVILASSLDLQHELLRQFAQTAPQQKILALQPPGPNWPPSLPLEFHHLPADATPREAALKAAVLLGLEHPTWNTAWGEALRLIASESLTLRVALKGPGGIAGDFYFVRGKLVSSRVTDSAGRTFAAEDVLYLPDIEFQTHSAESVLDTRAGRGLQKLIARGESLPAAESTIFPPLITPSTVSGLRNRNQTITVSVVEDDPRLRVSVRQILEEQPNLRLLDTYATAEEALGGLLERPPTVALFDLRLPGLSGLQLIARLAGHLSQTSFLAFSSQNDDHHISEFLRHGGAGYILKSDLANDLPEYIRAVAAGGTSLSPGVARRLLRFFALPHPLANPAIATLGKREEDLLDDLSRGRRLAEIARGSGQTESDLGRQLRLICRRFAATARAQSLADALSA